MPAATQEPRYDVFISYRRGPADELALLLQRELQRHNVQAFLDRDLRRGVFDETLLRRIAESPTFLIILTPGALDRCSDEEDWLRKEIVQALSSKRNIIPLQVDSFQFTSELVRALDPAIRKLFRYQAVVYSHDYFENTVERVARIIEADKAEQARQEGSNSGYRENARRSLLRLKWGLAGTLIAVIAVTMGLQLGRSSKSNARTGVTLPQETDTFVVRIELNPIDGQGYAWVPPGSFKMGCSTDDNECFEDEKPAHPVTIAKGFWLGRAPVTQAAYQRVIGTNPSHFRGEQLPVESVTWSEANAYCKAVYGRLPKEAEWEYAARAGSDELRYDNLSRIAWYPGNSDGQTHDVALKQPNRWGLYDMLGNVWEWVAESYAKYEENSPSDPTTRVVRGGSFEATWHLRSTLRAGTKPNNKSEEIGFRCVWEVLP